MEAVRALILLKHGELAILEVLVRAEVVDRRLEQAHEYGRDGNPMRNDDVGLDLRMFFPVPVERLEERTYLRPKVTAK